MRMFVSVGQGMRREVTYRNSQSSRWALIMYVFHTCDLLPGTGAAVYNCEVMGLALMHSQSHLLQAKNWVPGSH